MSDSMSYSEYGNMYPETVIIRKEGYFYMVRGQSAVVIHNFFSYRGWKSSNGDISIGFTDLDKVCTKLSEENITYAVFANGEIIGGENFDLQNRFCEFIDTDTSDIPYRESKKQKTVKSSIISEDEKKLCDVSIKYLERLLSGHNPVNNTVIEDDTVLMDDNVQRCFSFIVDILGRITADSEISSNPVPREVKKKDIQVLTYRPNSDEIISKMVQDREVPMAEMEGLISSYLSELFEEEVKKISATRISNWLVDKGYLARVEEDNGHHYREATENGLLIGMTNNVVQNGDAGYYMQYRFTPKAQRFVFENLAEIAKYKKQKLH